MLCAKLQAMNIMSNALNDKSVIVKDEIALL